MYPELFVLETRVFEQALELVQPKLALIFTYSGFPEDLLLVKEQASTRAFLTVHWWWHGEDLTLLDLRFFGELGSPVATLAPEKRSSNPAEQYANPGCGQCLIDFDSI